ncbi:MAG: hypothetical protein ABIW49_04245 [Knoellia sp.]
MTEPEMSWLGHHDLGSAPWVAWALVLFCVAGVVGSVVMVVLSDTPIATAGTGVLLLAMGIMMLPPALYGRGRSPGVKLGCVCLFLFGAALTILSLAGHVEPAFFEGRRGPVIRIISPGMAVLFFALSGVLLRRILRHRQ